MGTFQRLFNQLPAVKNIVCKNSSRGFSQTQVRQSYEGDGKTYVTILNKEHNAPLMIDSFSYAGFRLNNGLFVVGPVALFPQTILSWNVADDHEINEKSLSLFLNLAPRLDILLIGMGDSRQQQHQNQTKQNIMEMLRNLKPGDRPNIEVLPTEKAVTVYNFLTSEKRFVGAAMVPPTYYTPNLFDMYRTEYLTKKKEEGDFLLEEK